MIKAAVITFLSQAILCIRWWHDHCRLFDSLQEKVRFFSFNMFSASVNNDLFLSPLQIPQYLRFKVISAVTIFWGVKSYSVKNFYQTTRRHHPRRYDFPPNINKVLWNTNTWLQISWNFAIVILSLGTVICNIWSSRWEHNIPPKHWCPLALLHITNLKTAVAFDYRQTCFYRKTQCIPPLV
jgi:hypothetical protein